MVKSYKLLMLLLLATFTLGFTACTDEPDDYEVKTVTLDITKVNGNSRSDYVYVDDNSIVYYSSGYIVASGCKIGVIDNTSVDLSHVKDAPQDWRFGRNCTCTNYFNYAILTEDGKYYKMKVKLNENNTQITFTYQRYKPENFI